MSFDVVLHRFLGGDDADAACEPALSILRAACQNPDDETFDDINDIVLRDGSWVEMCAKGITSGDGFNSIGFWTRGCGFSPLVVTLMFDLARSSDMVIIYSGCELNSSNPKILLTSERQRGEVLPGLGPSAILCSSAQQLGEILDFSFKRWHNWAHSSIKTST